MQILNHCYNVTSAYKGINQRHLLKSARDESLAKFQSGWCHWSWHQYQKNCLYPKNKSDLLWCHKNVLLKYYHVMMIRPNKRLNLTFEMELKLPFLVVYLRSDQWKQYNLVEPLLPHAFRLRFITIDYHIKIQSMLSRLWI